MHFDDFLALRFLSLRSLAEATVSSDELPLSMSGCSSVFLALAKAAVMPDVASQWYFHPRKSDGWCAYGDIANDSSLASVNPEHLYLTLCECCTNHICPQYVVHECATAR